jgi:2-desacetyl-2-hydroxyethyl bacteriochlorophyllide A dehydrogenase
MRAIVYTDYGGPEVLELTERPTPKPARDEVLIRVQAAGVNPIDARMRAGELKGLLPGGFPRIPGYDVAGEVIGGGSDSPLRNGERVLAYLDHLYGGGYAETAVCTHTSVVRIPDAMRPDEAAALPLAGSTALQSLRDHGHLKAGDNVLINGASGGVGSFAVQIAAAYGATVTGVASGPHEDFTRSMGAADFIDYQTQDFTRLDRTWDLIFDAAGKHSFGDVKPVLSKDGTYVSTEPSLRGLIVSLLTWPRQQQGRVMLARSRDEDLRELLRLYEEGKLKVTVAELFPLAEAAAAHRRLEAGGFCGKLVLQVAPTW